MRSSSWNARNSRTNCLLVSSSGFDVYLRTLSKFIKTSVVSRYLRKQEEAFWGQCFVGWIRVERYVRGCRTIIYVALVFLVRPSRLISVWTVHIFNAIRPSTRYFAGVEGWIFQENYITESLNKTRLDSVRNLLVTKEFRWKRDLAAHRARADKRRAVTSQIKFHEIRMAVRLEDIWNVCRKYSGEVSGR